MTDCQICCEPMNKTNRRSVECAACHDTVCLACFERYVLDIRNRDPDCMFCSRVLMRSHILSIGGGFVKRFNAHRGEVLMERERARFPETISRIETQERIDAVARKIEEHERQIRALHTELTQIRFRGLTRTGQTPRIIPCQTEDCNGILGSGGLCQLCHHTYCSMCLQEKGESEHECKDEDKDTVKMIRGMSRPCPRCHINVSKISGCNQMFCTNCNCPFSYTTGREITTSFYHNPEYFEYLNNGGQQIRFNNGGGCVDDVDDVDGRVFRASYNIRHRTERTYFMNLIRSTRHLGDVQLRRLNARINDDNEALRYKYLTSEITKDEFRRRLNIREKRTEYYVNIHAILTTYRETVLAVLSTGDLATVKGLGDCKLQVQNLIQLSNSAMDQQASSLGYSHTFKIIHDRVLGIYA